MSLFIKWFWIKTIPHLPTNPHTDLIPLTKDHSKWITDIKCKVTKLLEDNTQETPSLTQLME